MTALDLTSHFKNKNNLKTAKDSQIYQNYHKLSKKMYNLQVQNEEIDACVYCSAKLKTPATK